MIIVIILVIMFILVFSKSIKKDDPVTGHYTRLRRNGRGRARKREFPSDKDIM